MGKTVGIDFGTTNSVLAFMECAEPAVIPNRNGARLTPSVVAFTPDNRILVGAPAKNQAIINFERTVSSVKRKLGSDFAVNLGDRSYTAVQIASFIFARLKEDAGLFFEEEVDAAVVTVPAYFNDAQRQAVKSAAELAGFRVMRLINEPTAAALAYGVSRGAAGTVAVFDLGGGTFDVSVLDVSREVFEVVATRGNNRLGGDDFDALIVEFICDSFFRENRIDLREDLMALQKVREAAENAKIELSASAAASINIPFISADKSGPKHVALSLAREQFEAMIAGYLDEISAIVDGALEDAGVEPDELDSLILVGGSTRIPAVGRLLESKFHTVRRNVNPDEAVALGAAIQAGIIAGGVRGLVLVDVAPLSLGIETADDVFVPIIERNTTIPVSKSRVFTTVADNQSVVEVNVLQGERPAASGNFSLGRFQLDDIERAPRGGPKIEVEFDIDANGIVSVAAKDLKTGSFREIVLDAAKTAAGDRVGRMLRDAESHRAEDEAFRTRIQLRSRAAGILEKVKNTVVKEGAQWLEQRPELLDTISLFEETMHTDDAEQLKIAIETLSACLEDGQPQAP
ncbi:MAG: molecular chaperone DnaK [bacterium]